MTGYSLSLLAGFLPMLLYAWFLYYLDRFEREPFKLVAGMFLWGALIAASGAFLINTISGVGILFLTRSNFATQLATSTLIAPIVEETLKGAAVLIVYLLFQPEFDSYLDGIVYAGIAALGFAAAENTWYIHQFGYQINGLQGLLEISLIRVVLVGWQHPFYTAFIGLGFAGARQAKDTIWRYLYPILGWSLAVATHLLHNLIAIMATNFNRGWVFNILWDWTGYLGLLILILLLIKREQTWMKIYLRSEVDRGLIDSKQYQIACSTWRQSLLFVRSFFQGNLPQVRRFYQVCGDLMHKSRQLSENKNEIGANREIQNLRNELKSYSKSI
jgi:RsiW-degrading membrane proteinase PrsW (M82 family)